MFETIAIEKSDHFAYYERIGPKDPMDLFDFKDPFGVHHIYCKLMQDGVHTLGSYKRLPDSNITSVVIINHLN